MMEFAVFATRFSTQHAAINGDPQISVAHRAAFRQHIENCSDVFNLNDHADQFCHAHQLVEAVVGLRAGERVGRAHRRVDFISLIANSLGLSTNDVEDLLQDWAALGPPGQLAEIHARIGHLAMSRYIIWAFRNNQFPLQPLEGLEIADLPRLLGLQYVSGTQFLFWEFEPPVGVDLHSPTAFDAGMRYMLGWRPGGLTTPNPECRDKYAVGMPEVVLRPVNFRAITGRLRWTP
jgi:hypothetical protein